MKTRLAIKITLKQPGRKDNWIRQLYCDIKDCTEKETYEDRRSHWDSYIGHKREERERKKHEAELKHNVTAPLPPPTNSTSKLVEPKNETKPASNVTEPESPETETPTPPTAESEPTKPSRRPKKPLPPPSPAQPEPPKLPPVISKEEETMNKKIEAKKEAKEKVGNVWQRIWDVVD